MKRMLQSDLCLFMKLMKLMWKGFFDESYNNDKYNI